MNALAPYLITVDSPTGPRYFRAYSSSERDEFLDRLDSDGFTYTVNHR